VLAAQLTDHVAHLDDLDRVQTLDRLVQNQERRPVNDRLRDADALPIAVRELTDRLPQHLFQAAQPHCAVAHLVQLGTF
jgi:hypothetical protein